MRISADDCGMRTIATSAWSVFAFAWLVWLGVVIITTHVAVAHEHNGTNYSNWTNQDGSWCCNNQDCHELADEDLRVVDNHYEVFLHDLQADGTMSSDQGRWCEVKSHHFTKTGNDPNGDAVHICAKVEPANSCKLLICFRPKTGF